MSLYWNDKIVELYVQPEYMPVTEKLRLFCGICKVHFDQHSESETKKKRKIQIIGIPIKFAKRFSEINFLSPKKNNKQNLTLYHYPHTRLLPWIKCICRNPQKANFIEIIKYV